MNKFDLVKLTNKQTCKKYGLNKDSHGIFIEEYLNMLKVLFFNPNSVGEYIVRDVEKQDIQIDDEKLPKEMQKELEMNLDKILTRSKENFEPVKFKEYDLVELLVEKEKYAKFGVHKGDTGCVVSENAINNYIDVDFSGIDKNGKFYGDVIMVKIDDLKKKE